MKMTDIHTGDLFYVRGSDVWAWDALAGMSHCARLPKGSQFLVLSVELYTPDSLVVDFLSDDKHHYLILTDEIFENDIEVLSHQEKMNEAAQKDRAAASKLLQEFVTAIVDLVK